MTVSETVTDDIKLTRLFQTSSGDYFATLMWEWMPRYGWTLLLPVLLSCLAGCVLHDERWLLVGLMLLFIVIPMAMSFLYTYYMLTPEVRRAVLPKRVEIADGRYLKLIYAEMAENMDENNPTEDNDVKVTPLPPAEYIDWSEVKKVRYTSRFRIYYLRGQRMQFLLIPHDSLIVSQNQCG